MEIIELQDKIKFIKPIPEANVSFYHDNDLFGIKEKVGITDNFFSSMGEITTFRETLGDFGINAIAHYRNLDDPNLRGCEHEIRISPVWTFAFFRWNEEQNSQIRYEIYADAWFGSGGIFKEQIEPDNPLGVNLSARLEESDSSMEAMFDFFRTTCEQLPEKGAIVELQDYVGHYDLSMGEKISDFQIRLLYQDPHSQFRDLVSAFKHINRRLCMPFELIIEE